MDELVQKAIQQSIVLKKLIELTPWKVDEPWPQAWYSWDSFAEIWQPIHELPAWNIDFMLPCAEARMSAALAHLEELIGQLPQTTAVIMNLQEVTPSDLITISQEPWIRERFFLTDLDSSAWGPRMYGTTMLVDRRLSVKSCFRAHYAATQMERDALFVDITASTSKGKIRIGNSHLESLPLDPSLRPTQVRTAAKYLHEDGLAGAVLAGDFNAIQPFDSSLNSDNNLKDAYLELGGQGFESDSEEGATWGRQAHPVPRERFGLSRMDKAYFCGNGIKLRGFERIGADVVVDGEGKNEQKERLLALGFEKAWVTDHLGIKVTFGIVQDAR
ncbi:hypothetical protein PG985_013313, partial [Apiospora marii]|uniref:uncharacterized protein n=1 Tax=Apiospora marii TaxID=335849 RepID=UPI00313244AD